MSERIRQINFNIDSLKGQFDRCDAAISTRLPSDLYTHVRDLTQKALRGENGRCKQRQIEKYNKLKGNVKSKQVDNENKLPQNVDRWVINLSDRTLSDSEKTLLCRGLNFAVTPSKLPYDDLIVCTEQAARILGVGSAESAEVRAKQGGHSPERETSSQ